MASNQNGETAGEKIDYFEEEGALRRYWLENNPLYGLSFLVLFYGFYKVEAALFRGESIPALKGWDRLFLFSSVELYSWILMAGGFLLYRSRHELNASLWPGFLAALLLFDATLRLITLHTLPEIGSFPLWPFLWIGLFGLKLYLLSTIYRIQFSIATAALLTVLAATMTALPLILAKIPPHFSPSLEIAASMVGIAIWIGLFSILLFIHKLPAPLIIPTRVKKGNQSIQGPSPHQALSTAVDSIIILIFIIYFIHCGGSGYLNNIDWPALIIALLIPGLWSFLLFSEEESVVWWGSLILLAMSHLLPALMLFTNLMTATLFWKRWKKFDSPAMATAGAFFLAITVVSWRNYTPHPINLLDFFEGVWPLWWEWGIIALGLLYAAFVARAKSAMMIIALGIIFGIPWSRIIPDDPLEIGIALLGLGFVSLVAGLGVSWWFRRMKTDRDETAATLGEKSEAEGGDHVSG
ncbi:hypothetical protein ACQZV8_19150 [Magnetococcales bacterium HHB-1]